MLGFVEQFRRPKMPIVRGSPQKDGSLHDRETPRSPTTTLPVRRNFSYPTNIANNAHPLSLTARAPSAWDQLGQMCTFSPEIAVRARRARIAGLEDPFFYTTDTTPYTKVEECDESLGDDPEGGTQPTGLLLPPRHPGNAECNVPRDKVPQHKRGRSIGGHIFLQKPKVAARLKRNSLGCHRISVSFDATRFLSRRSNSIERPISSSGVPLIDTRLTHTNNPIVEAGVSLPPGLSGAAEDFSIGLGETTVASRTDYRLQGPGPEPRNIRDSLQRLQAGVSKSNKSPLAATSEPDRRKGKGRKGCWFSQFKAWVSVSEPSSQASKDYRATALASPQTGTKLHQAFTSSTLPPEIGEASGGGPDCKQNALRTKWRETLQ
ncbi:hypothetical protein GGS20DRAFT_579617 [Poronia punctata]|nr:hypothetical protein GGS20DRAFT_579617 [Poronia punctata]